MRTAILVLIPAVAIADPKPTRLAMKRTEATNLHMAGNRGAMHWQADVSITVDLFDNAKVEAKSVGKTVDHALDGGPKSRSTDDETAWTTRWNGTWAITGGKLRLDLSLIDHTCKSERKTTEYDGKQWVNYKPEPLACKVASKTAVLECTLEQVTLVDPATAKKTQAAAWRCNAQPSTELAESRSQWVLGRATCIATVGGKMSGESFAPCAP